MKHDSMMKHCSELFGIGKIGPGVVDQGPGVQEKESVYSSL